MFETSLHIKESALPSNRVRAFSLFTMAALSLVRPLPWIFTRCYSSFSALPLSFTLHEPPQAADTKAAPMLVMHGLFGSKQNNRSISK